MVRLAIEVQRTYECPSGPLLQPFFWGPVGAATADIASAVVGGSDRFAVG